MLCWDFPQVTGKSAGKRMPHVIKASRFPKFVHLHCSNVKRHRPLCFFYAATTSVERIFKDWFSSSSAWMGHLEGSWLGPVFRLACGLWPSFQRGALNENRTHKPLDSSHFCWWAEVRQRGKSRLVKEKVLKWRWALHVCLKHRGHIA